MKAAVGAGRVAPPPLKRRRRVAHDARCAAVEANGNAIPWFSARTWVRLQVECNTQALRLCCLQYDGQQLVGRHALAGRAVGRWVDRWVRG